MKKTASLFLVLILATALLAGCGGNPVKAATDALEKSGLRSAFFSRPDMPDYLSPEYDIGDPLPDIKVSTPIYRIEYDDSGSGRFTSASAEGGKFTDADAMTKGTLVFMVSRDHSTKVYNDKKGNTFRGDQESLRVYLYDIDSRQFFGEKTFYGEPLENSYSNYRGPALFVNRADRKEVEAWIDTFR